MNGYNIALDVNGGSVHILDDLSYKMLDFYEDKTIEQIIAFMKDEFDEKSINESYNILKIHMKIILVL